MLPAGKFCLTMGPRHWPLLPLRLQGLHLQAVMSILTGLLVLVVVQARVRAVVLLPGPLLLVTQQLSLQVHQVLVHQVLVLVLVRYNQPLVHVPVRWEQGVLRMQALAFDRACSASACH